MGMTEQWIMYSMFVHACRDMNIMNMRCLGRVNIV